MLYLKNEISAGYAVNAASHKRVCNDTDKILRYDK